MPIDISEFANEPATNFNEPASAQTMRDALVQAQREFGKEYPLLIGGEPIKTGQKIRSLNPSNPKDVVGIVQRATVAHAEQALAAATVAFGDERDGPGWRWTPAEVRAKYALRAAAAMRRRRCELNAWLILEAGKSWNEADGDVAEAIDFCEFYAREALRYDGAQPVGRVPGEKTELFYLPLGVGVVIPPWNFPFAILTGMTVAAWVTGNTVVLKPSSETPIIAVKFMEVMDEIGLPPGVVNLVTGPGCEVGDHLVADPRTRFVAFTGSREVGLHVVEQAAVHRPGQRWIKRVIAEMGGKNATIIDDESDLDAAVDGVALAAYGFQGQKCSACSRAIVAASVHDRFVERLAARIQEITVGPVSDMRHWMGPVISERQLKSVQKYIDIGRGEGRVVCGGKRISTDGFFLEPTLVADVEPKARIAQEEIFGPVCAVLKANSFEEALQIANGTEYGLTGAVFSNNRQHLERARREFFVGNLYLNRKSSGALVSGHPFGGFNMSGTDSKAGGRDYLSHFLQAKSVAERL
ncbi:MAG: L-glutamate gamma-semialdehyde dehydrogenase [Deltaproteobacteria bacterium]|nr:L-glutamate gamma-semialdehyde dehydrogenase [Deltaproteobacteria bacterium]